MEEVTGNFEFQPGTPGPPKPHVVIVLSRTQQALAFSGGITVGIHLPAAGYQDLFGQVDAAERWFLQEQIWKTSVCHQCIVVSLNSFSDRALSMSNPRAGRLVANPVSMAGLLSVDRHRLSRGLFACLSAALAQELVTLWPRGTSYLEIQEIAAKWQRCLCFYTIIITGVSELRLL